MSLLVSLQAEHSEDPAQVSLPETEEVDAFGRALRKEDRERSSRSRDRSRDRSRESRDRRRSRDRSRDRDDSRERDRFRPRYGDRPRSGRRYGGSGGYGRYQHDRGRHRGYHDGFRGPPDAPPMSDFVSLPPMPSFQHFMRTQLDDVSPEEYQQRYKQFQMDYLVDFEACFFQNYHHLEWFQEHYDPFKQSKLQDKAVEWAKDEAEKFKEDLKVDAASFIARCRLGPPEPRPQLSPDDDGYAYSDGMLWRGLTDRTLVMKGFAGKIAKSVLDTALRQAFGDIEIELMAFSDPGKSAHRGFERTVWVVLMKPEDVQPALQALKDLNLVVPEEFDELTGSVRHSIEFPVNTQKHVPRPPKRASPDMSNASRVVKDTDQSLTLAELLDAERRVPEECRIGALLQDSDLNVHCTEPTDKLDLTIAYLRRVHCFAYYGGYDCRDIGDMLSSQPHVVHRVLPYREDEPAPEVSEDRKRAREDGEATGEDEAGGDEAASAAPETAATEKPATDGQAEGNGASGDTEGQSKDATSKPASTDKDKEEGEEEGEEGAADDGNDGEEDSPHGDDEDGAHTDFFAKHMDRRVEARMAIARSRIENAQKGVEPEALQKERKEVEECVDAWLAKHSEELPKGLVQCRYEHDKPKKFKAIHFLHKHLLTKHAEMLELELVPVLTPYMRVNYDKEQSWEKPLPPVSVESQGGITNIPFNKLSAQITRGARGGRFERTDRRPMRGRGGRGRRPYGGRGYDTFHSYGDSRPQQVYIPPRQEDNDSRRLQSYVDIDAPQEVAAGLDYGSVLAPPKKRRLLKPTKE